MALSKEAMNHFKKSKIPFDCFHLMKTHKSVIKAKGYKAQSKLSDSWRNLYVSIWKRLMSDMNFGISGGAVSIQSNNT